jgi:hypothetical protein
MQLGTDIPAAEIKSISLFAEEDPLLVSGPYNGASVVMPAAGIFDYSQIQSYLKQKLSTDPVTREGANIIVLNGSGVAGVAQSEADKLTDAGFIVSEVGNAPEDTYADVEVYQIGEGMTGTKSRLASNFGVTIKTTDPPLVVPEGTNFVVIIGKDRSSN